MGYDQGVTSVILAPMEVHGYYVHEKKPVLV